MKLYDIHFEVGLYQPTKEEYAYTVLGTMVPFLRKEDSILNALRGLVSDLSAMDIFKGLIKYPHQSYYPIPCSLGIEFQKFFELHIECGSTTSLSRYYAKTIINGKEYISSNGTIDMAIFELMNYLHNAYVYPMLTSAPSLSVYPFKAGSGSKGSVPSAVLVEESKPKKDIKRRLPSDLVDRSYPECTSLCTSWDIFGKGKCRNMCEWRPEV